MKIEYEIFNPKVDRPLKELTRPQAKEAYDWFIENLDERIIQLQMILVTSGSGITLDYSEESLSHIHEFFCELSKNDFRNQNEHPSADLLSLSNDISIYMAGMLFRKYDHLHWKLNEIDKNISYQRPIISGFPVKNKDFNYDFGRILIAYAYRLIMRGLKEGKKEERILLLYLAACKFAENDLRPVI